MGVVLDSQPLTVALVAILGISAFATIAPLQMRVLQSAGPSGQNLASSLNIAAFNLGNALGAWAGGFAIDSGWGLPAVPFTAAGITAAGIVLAALSLRLDARSRLKSIAA